VNNCPCLARTKRRPEEVDPPAVPEPSTFFPVRRDGCLLRGCQGWALLCQGCPRMSGAPMPLYWNVSFYTPRLGPQPVWKPAEEGSDCLIAPSVPLLEGCLAYSRGNTRAGMNRVTPQQLPFAGCPPHLIQPFRAQS
jgi:hypothetical protein